MDFFEPLYLFFQSEAFQNIVSILKPVCIFAIFIFSGVVIWAMIKSPWLYWYVSADFSDFKSGGPVEPETIVQKKWKKIKKRLESPSHANWKLAIIESEELVEDTLEKMGYKGEGIREKLKNVDPGVITNLNNLISSYDIFINILAEPDYQITKDRAIKIVSAFEDVLKEFELL